MNKYSIFSLLLILICTYSNLYGQYDGVYMYKTINEVDWEQINIVNGQVSYSYAQQKKGAILLSKVGSNTYKFPGLSQLYTLTIHGNELNCLILTDCVAAFSAI